MWGLLWLCIVFHSEFFYFHYYTNEIAFKPDLFEIRPQLVVHDRMLVGSGSVHDVLLDDTLLQQ